MPKINIRLSAKSGDPKSQQIANQIAAAIQSGKFKPGDMLPTERALEEQVGVTRKVIRRAYQQLAERGMVETLGTVGRRVAGGGVAKKAGKAATKKAAAGTKKAVKKK
jgi:DNA-binding GntR family transcriptional regulator